MPHPFHPLVNDVVAEFAADCDIGHARREALRELLARFFGPGVLEIAAERLRQQSGEGFSPDFDAKVNARGELAEAAGCYAHAAAEATTPAGVSRYVPGDWPWGDAAWKPKPTVFANAVRAGALLAAELDRLAAAAAAAENADRCVRCGGAAVSRCKCPMGHRVCESGHRWYFTPTGGRIDLGPGDRDTHAGPETAPDAVVG